MPKSKLGLDLTVKQLCKRHKLNPVTKLIELLKATDSASKDELSEKGPYLKFLCEMQASKPKPTEIKSVSDTKPIIIHKDFILSPNFAPEPEVNRLVTNTTDGIDPAD